MGTACLCYNKKKTRIIQDPNASLDCAESDKTVVRSTRNRAIKNSLIIHKATLESKRNSKIITDPNSLVSWQYDSTQQDPLISREQTNCVNAETVKSEHSNGKQYENIDNFKTGVQSEVSEKEIKQIQEKKVEKEEKKEKEEKNKTNEKLIIIQPSEKVDPSDKNIQEKIKNQQYFYLDDLNKFLQQKQNFYSNKLSCSQKSIICFMFTIINQIQAIFVYQMLIYFLQI